MTKEKVIPQIRFSGFTDTWEQHKLGDHSEIVAVGLQIQDILSIGIQRKYRGCHQER